MSGEYIDHAVAAGYRRNKNQRYCLQIDLAKTNGGRPFPERPLPVCVNEESRQNVIEAIGGKIKIQEKKDKATMYFDQLNQGVIGSFQYNRAIQKLLNSS